MQYVCHHEMSVLLNLKSEALRSGSDPGWPLLSFVTLGKSLNLCVSEFSPAIDICISQGLCENSVRKVIQQILFARSLQKCWLCKALGGYVTALGNR